MVRISSFRSQTLRRIHQRGFDCLKADSDAGDRDGGDGRGNEDHRADADAVGILL